MIRNEFDVWLRGQTRNVITEFNWLLTNEAARAENLRRARTPARLLWRFRAWFVACAALTLYLTWVAVVEYRVHMREPAYVLSNLAVLLAWWGVFVRTCVAWTRNAAAARRAAHPHSSPARLVTPDAPHTTPSPHPTPRRRTPMSQQPHPATPGQHAPPPPATAKKPRRWPWILAILAAFGIGTAVGSAGNSSTPAAAPAPSTSAVATAPAQSTAAAPATQPATQPAEPAGPKTEFGDGTYLVGTDIAVGAYKTAGPRPNGIGQCYWARLKDDSGTNIIANNIGAGATRVTVKKGEYLQVTGCDFTKA